MPPKLIEKTWQGGPELRGTTQIKAFAVETLGRQGLAHGLFRVLPAQKKVLYLSPDAQDLYQSGLVSNAIPSRLEPKRGESALEAFHRLAEKAAPLVFKHRRGSFSLRQHSLDYRPPGGEKGFPLWSIDLGGGDDLSVESNGGGEVLSAWSRFPNTLFFLPGRMDFLYRVSTTEETEGVRFFACSPRHLLWIENLRNGLSRFVFFDESFRPLGYTVFDFSGEARQSDVAAVDPSSSCEDLYLGGSFGLAHVRYPRGAFAVASPAPSR